MVLAILQARMSSRRLPGKVLRPILGAPMLGRQIERLRRSQSITRLVVATSVLGEDDALERFCEQEGVDCHRGPLEDVLGRFLGALEAFGPAENFLRLTGDCPLCDPALVDRAVRAHAEAGADYTYVQETWSFPKGLDVEVCRTEVLEAIAGEACGPDREHVTAFIYARPDRFKLCALNQTPPQRFRWTVDTPEDFAFVTKVYEALYPSNPSFSTADILAWQARHPDQVLVNRLPDEEGV